jgi:hypothetical protein
VTPLGTNEATRNAIAALLAGGGVPVDTGVPGGADFGAYEYPVEGSDPASEGNVAAETGPTGVLGGNYGQGFGAIVGGDMGMSMAQQSQGNVQADPGTGLGLATPGYGSNLGHAHAANMADQAMTALSVMDAIDTSIAVNNAVEEGGYTSPSPAPDPGYTSPDPSSTIVGLPGDFSTAQASLSDMSDAAASGFGTGTGFSSANAANDAVAGALADAGDAAGIAGLGGLGDSSGDSSSGGTGGGGDGGK